MIQALKNIILGFLLFYGIAGNLQAQSQTEKPWTFWWWMGSAVSKNDIRWQLENFSKAGLGGVHVIPIYGVKGYEKQFIPFLSKEWMEMLRFTILEAKRLDLGVDMTTGTGWPFGGPQVTSAMAAKKYRLTDGKFITEATGQKVKRAAPGGEGFVLDPFGKEAIEHYLKTFDLAFANADAKPRAMYNDSYEVFGANWTDNFLAEFKKRRGYDLGLQMNLFLDTTHNESSVLIKMDYHQTLAELLLENFTREWTRWGKRKGFLTRNQAHGSPGNLLDLYALTDIPETESFGSSRLPIPGLRIEENYEPKRFGTPNPLAMKFASSAANLTGKKLVSSETATWLGDHFKVSLSQVKPQVDELFAAGINHIFYHGIAYSPKNEPYPGWLFYASTNFGIQSHFWKQLPLLNQYVQRCQLLLQKSEPDNDILVYFPIHDLWAKPISAGGIHSLDVHHVDRWLSPSPFGKLCQQLQQEGFTFDYISDGLLEQVKVDKQGTLNSGYARYKTLVVPTTEYLPEPTLARLIKLAEQGAKIIFIEKLPQRVTGFNKHEERNKNFIQNLDKLRSFTKNVSVTSAWKELLSNTDIIPESFTKRGLNFIRKKYRDNQLYFVTNLNNQFTEGWIELSTSAGNIKYYAPLTDSSYYLPVRESVNKKTEVYLTLVPGQSCFLLRGDKKREDENFTPEAFQPLKLQGRWKIEFTEGKPAISHFKSLDTLSSWTNLSDSAAYFSGTATYSLEFDLPDSVLNKKKYKLDLGDVRESAAVTLNGKNIGTAWCIPFQLEIDKALLKPENNTLEIAVTNLSANYMRLRDKQLPDWKKFYDINFVDIKYRPFDPSKWQPMPSGLLNELRILYR